jgi:plasmid stability protein
MASLTIRRLDDEVYSRLRDRAQANGRSLEAEAREILSENARAADDMIEDLLALNREMKAKHGVMPDSASLLREERDGW